MANSLISVIIPTYNRKSILEKTIQSVEQQTLRSFDIIVVDDGSTDGTIEWLKQEHPSVKVFLNKNKKGGAGARNYGAEQSNSKYIAFLDSDDHWHKDHLSQSLDLIHKLGGDGSFSTFYLDYGVDKEEIAFGIEHVGTHDIASKLFGPERFDARTSTFVFEKFAFDQVKFDENLGKHQDWDLALNFDKKFRFVCSQQASVYLATEHGGSRMSHKPNHEATRYFINKNKHLLTTDQLFTFVSKRILQAQQHNEGKAIVDEYLFYFEGKSNGLKPKNKIMYTGLKLGVLNLAQVYKIQKKIQKL